MSTKRAQIYLDKAAHNPSTAQILDLENQHGDPDHPNI